MQKGCSVLNSSAFFNKTNIHNNIMYKLKDSGTDIAKLQIRLGGIYNKFIYPNGIFDTTLETTVKTFQLQNKLTVDGLVGPQTLKFINDKFAKVDKFMVCIDAGHGGIDPKTGKYTSFPNKYSKHPGYHLHTEDGFFFEGHENRIIAIEVMKQLREQNIFVVQTHLDYADAGSDDLVRRANLVRMYLAEGYYGYLHSFHSNAIGSDNTEAKLRDTTGGIVYTTAETDFSDKISEVHINNWLEKFDSNWVWRLDDKTRKKAASKSSDYEANFYVIRKYSDYPRFGAILEEFGFDTSWKDCLFIINPENRLKRIACAIKTALWVKANI